MKIAIGSDHRGVELKDKIVDYLRAHGHSVTDMGTQGSQSVDYPDFAAQVAQAVAGRDADRGILICGSGIGMCIAANKFKGVRAAICCSPELAVRGRLHNDANVLCLGADFVSAPEALAIVEKFIVTDFEGGRHQRRLDKIAQTECGLLDNK